MKIVLPAASQSSVIGRSRRDRAIEISAFGAAQATLPARLLGGVHGDESEGYFFAERYCAELAAGTVRLDPAVRLYICPRLNPDGCADNRRTNGHNVDLNRNLPTKDWTADFSNVRYYPGAAAGSEPESALTVALLETIQPAMIISLHSYEKPMINFNGPCETLAQAMSEINYLPPKGDIGYPTPGSLGTYAGWERGIPTITLEILRGQDPDTVWRTNRQAVTAGLEFYLTHPRPA